MATGIIDNQVEGINPVLEALRGRRRVRKIIFSEELADKKQMAAINSEALKRRIKTVELPKNLFLEKTTIETHQGVLAETEPYPYISLNELAIFSDAKETPILLLFDHITDPQNFGALIRTAEAVGVYSCIVTKRNAPHITSAVAKASAGAVEHMRICQVANLVNSMKQLKKLGLWFVGATEAAETKYYDIDMAGPIGIVLGSEGKGISRLTARECDFLAAIPMSGKVDSLNVSVAGAIMMFEARRQRSVLQRQS